MPIKELNREEFASWKYLKLSNIILENGRKYEVCSRTTKWWAVAWILRHIEKKCFILIKQYRYTLKDYVIELVAGIVDKDKHIDEIMKEEVIEETGYRDIVSMNYLLETSGSAWAFSETLHLYDIEITWEKYAQKLGSLEDIEVIEVPYDEIISFLENESKNYVIDPKIGLWVIMIMGKIK